MVVTSIQLFRLQNTRVGTLPLELLDVSAFEPSFGVIVAYFDQGTSRMKTWLEDLA